MVTAYTGNEPYIFISYSHRDMDLVLPVLEGLQNGNLRFWFDNGIEAGSEWPEYVAERMLSCHSVIAFMSANAQDSHNCRREIHFAIEENKPLLVVYLEDFKLSPGMRLQLGSLQAMFRNKYSSVEEFSAHLCSAAILAPCYVEKNSATVENDAAEVESGDDVVCVNEAKDDTCNTQNEVGGIVDAEIMTRLIGEFNTARLEANTVSVFKKASEVKRNKLQNYINYLKFDISPDDIEWFLDDTLFGNGKSGYAITKDKFYSGGLLLSKFVIDLNSIDEVKYDTTKSSNLIFIFKDGSVKDTYFNNYAKFFYSFFKSYAEAKKSV